VLLSGEAGPNQLAGRMSGSAGQCE
jgi:hypothetical protein